MKKSFVPDDFKVPGKLETGKFRLRMLSVDDLEKDYEAVMSSVEHLKDFFGPGTGWPSPDMTIEYDLKDLEWHQQEFIERKSFAYTVMSLDESVCLGCVYFKPSKAPQFDVMTFSWVRASELANNLDEELYHVVKQWLDRKWPFKNVAFPGREIDWDTWQQLLTK